MCKESKTGLNDSVYGIIEIAKKVKEELPPGLFETVFNAIVLAVYGTPADLGNFWDRKQQDRP